MKNPLNKRVLRELGTEWMKYLVLFLLLTLVIGMISGMYVANDSMLTAATDAYEKYDIEDGHFELKNKAADELIEAFENENITVYEQFYKDFDEDSDLDGKTDASARIFVMREDVNRACLMEGNFPENSDEIVIDRMHADNRKIKVGDEISLGNTKMTVCGLVAFSDYSTLYEDASDMMFDALTFNVGAVTEEAFEKLPGKITYQYAYRLPERTEENKAQETAEELVEKLAALALTGGLTDDGKEAENIATDPELLQKYMERKDIVNEIIAFVPEYANPAIHFAPNDMGSDKAIGEVMLLVLVTVLAFISAITQNNTIENEAAVIGTLRSSGYTRAELLRHYLTCPALVTLLAAFVGNILGYTVFKEVVVSMYYNSYSLPTYVTVWNTDAFVKTTLFPMLLMVFINFFVINRRLKLSPLKFLRRDLSTSKRKKAMRLPRWKFMSRFRLRILLQNIGGYLTLFVGIAFVMLLLGFCVGMPATLKHYQDNAVNYIVADYQYILKDTADKEGNSIDEKNCEGFGIADELHAR